MREGQVTNPVIEEFHARFHSIQVQFHEFDR
jgi:hypothetical protein